MNTNIRQQKKYRPHYLGQTNFYNLNAACKAIDTAFNFAWSVCLVGSALRTKNYRDVDVRAIVPDEFFDRLFPDVIYTNFLNTAISEWLQARTGLPVDFQIQRATDANKEFPAKGNPRNALGAPL